MKKYALSLVELLIAMSLIAVLSLFSIRGLKVYLIQDNDLLKYKGVLGSISEAVYQLLDDDTMYPSKKGFADTRRGKYPDDEKIYEGASKFRKLFKSKFNILNGQLEFCANTVGKVPAYKYFTRDTDNGGSEVVEKIASVNFSELFCFKENRGVTYCLPDTPVDGKLSAIYLRVYFNDVDETNPSTFDNTKAIYFEISNLGKINLIPTVTADNRHIIDCYDNTYKGYNHCIVRANAARVNIHRNKPSV